MEVKEVEKVKEMTIEALGNTSPAIRQFNQLFEECSDLFDQAKEEEAIARFQEIIGVLAEFAHFCASVREVSADSINTETSEKFNRLCSIMESDLGSLTNEMEHRNFIEISEILRYDMVDLMVQFGESFESIKTEMMAEQAV